MAAKQETNKKIRVSLDLPEPFNNRLEALEKLTLADSKASVIRQALQVYEYIARRAAEGYSFRALSPQGREENLVFFGLPVASTSTSEDRELVRS